MNNSLKSGTTSITKGVKRDVVSEFGVIRILTNSRLMVVVSKNCPKSKSMLIW